MNMLLEIIEKIEIVNPRHGKKLRTNLESCDEAYLKHSDSFLKEYVKYLGTINKDINYAIDCYLKVVADMLYEQLRFLRSGRYSCSTFDKVNEKVYSNPDVMEYHTQGLLLSQILWVHHYKMFSFFSEHLPSYRHKVKRYLEIGAGHGLYVSEAIKILGADVHVDVVDISATSIEIAKKIIDDDSVNYILQDIFNFSSRDQYDFITMGEVLEHVEDPVALLSMVRGLMYEKGSLFITVPINAPAIDHIFLFKNTDEVRKAIECAGFEIIDEISALSEKIPPENAEKLKVPLLYGAFIEKFF